MALKFQFLPNAGLEFFKLVIQGVAGLVFVQCFSLARHRGYMPIHIRVLRLELFGLLNAPVSGVGKYNFFITVQQGIHLRDVMSVGRRGMSVGTNPIQHPRQCRPSCPSDTNCPSWFGASRGLARPCLND